MAAAYVGEKAVGSTTTVGTTTAITLASAASAGNTVVLMASFRSQSGPSTATVSDAKGNTWTVDVQTYDATNKEALLIASTRQDAGALASGDAVTITWGANAATNDVAWLIEEFSGLLTASAVDQTGTAVASAVGTTGTVSAAGATAQADEVAVGAFSINTNGLTGTADSAWSQFTSLISQVAGGPTTTDKSLLAQYKILSATGTPSFSPSWSISQVWCAGIVTYKASGGSTPQNVSKFANANAVVTTGWTSPTNAYADDGVYATAAPGKNLSVTSDFGFPAFTTSDIPAGSTINSVTIEIQHKESTTASIATIGVQVNNNGTLLGTEQTDTTEPAADTLLTHQVTSGISLTDLQTANLVKGRVRAARGNTNTAYTASLDYVKITVNYTPPSSTTVSKGGGATSPASANGTKGYCLARSAGAISPAKAGGTKNVATGAAKTGGAISVASASGAKTVTPFVVGSSALLDTFDRADGAPGSNWAAAVLTYSVAPIASNRLTLPQFNGEIWNPSTFGPDQEAYYTSVDTGNGFPDVSILLRWTNPDSGSEKGYTVKTRPGGSAEAFVLTAGTGTSTSLGFFASGLLSTETHVLARVVGNTVSLYGSADGVTWNLRRQWTDNTITGTGNIGLFSGNNSFVGAAENFGGGTIPVSAVAKSGGAVSPASANGTKAARFAKASGAISPASSNGTRAYKYARSAGAVSLASASGTRAYKVARASGAISPASGGGTKNVATGLAKSGGAVSGASANGTRVYKVARASGAISVGSANGTRSYKIARSSGAISVASASGSKAFSAVKFAGAISPASGGATRLTKAVKSAGAVSPSSGGATKAARFVKASVGAISPASGGGVKGKAFPRTAGAISISSGGGSKRKLVARSAGAVSTASGAGTWAYQIARNGGAISVASAGGTKNFVTGAVKTGGAVSAGSGSATKVARFVKSAVGGISVSTGGASRAVKIARSSGAISVVSANGVRATRVSKFSGAISVASGSGSKVYRVARASGAIAIGTGGATRAYSMARSGSATSVSSGGGLRSTQVGKIAGGISDVSGSGLRFARFATAGGSISVVSGGGSVGFGTIIYLVDGGAISVSTGGGLVHHLIILPAGHGGAMVAATDEGGLITSTIPEKSTMLPTTATATIISGRERAELLAASEGDGDLISAKG